MHLLAAQPGGFSDDEGIIDLAQTPADIVILSAADSSLAALAGGAELLDEDFPSIRLANWMQLLKPAAFDLYQDKVLDHAQVVVVSLLGGASYWQYGFSRLQDWLANSRPSRPRQLIIVPGDDTEDAALFAASSVDENSAKLVWRFLREGGQHNISHFYHYLAEQFFAPDDARYQWRLPQTLPNALIYMPANLYQEQLGQSQSSQSQHSQSKHSQHVSLKDWQQRWQLLAQAEQTVQAEQHNHKHKQNKQSGVCSGVCIVLFYRSHLQSDNTAMFDGLIEQVRRN